MLVLYSKICYTIVINRGKDEEEAAMKNDEKNKAFLQSMNDAKSKGDIFKALFDACGTNDDVNTNHVFFKDVIINLRADEAKGMMTHKSPLLTTSHYVDLALGTYHKLGFDINDFEKDLDKQKKDTNLLTAQKMKLLATRRR